MIMLLSLILLIASGRGGWPGTLIVVAAAAAAIDDDEPAPKPWPPQFHSILMVNNSGYLSQMDFWYDWPNGGNFYVIQNQLASEQLYELKWNNGTSFFYNSVSDYCQSAHQEIGILRPDWMQGANYLGQRLFDGFLCNVWEKVDYVWYYEEVVTREPVHWRFNTGRSIHVITFEVGAVLEDEKWQAPSDCFREKNETQLSKDPQQL